MKVSACVRAKAKNDTPPCVIWSVLWTSGEHFFVTSYLFISAAFKATIAIKVFKTIYMISTIDWRALHVCALGCTRVNPTPTVSSVFYFGV